MLVPVKSCYSLIEKKTFTKHFPIQKKKKNTKKQEGDAARVIGVELRGCNLS